MMTSFFKNKQIIKKIKQLFLNKKALKLMEIEIWMFKVTFKYCFTTSDIVYSFTKKQVSL